VIDLVIATAEQFMAGDLAERWRARRAARETEVSRHISRTFLERGGPVPVDDIVAGFPDDSVDEIRRVVGALDEDDLIRVRDGHVDIAYPFSAAPTPSLVRLPDGDERSACCAMDALGIAAMVGWRFEVRSRCHHCSTALEFPVTPHGPGAEAAGVMLWIGRRADDRCKVADSRSTTINFFRSEEHLRAWRSSSSSWRSSAGRAGSSARAASCWSSRGCTSATTTSPWECDGREEDAMRRRLALVLALAIVAGLVPRSAHADLRLATISVKGMVCQG